MRNIFEALQEGRECISPMDLDHLRMVRASVTSFLREMAQRYPIKGTLLDIAPQDHKGAVPYFTQALVETLGLDPDSGCDIIGDITKFNDEIPHGKYDAVVCTEVLEHTLNPFSAVQEISRILKAKGFLFLTVPFNLRIHGPAPDCWRFTEYGIHALLSPYFENIEVTPIETPGRILMPIHYRVAAEKKGL